jgi:thioredoxin 1
MSNHQNEGKNRMPPKLPRWTLALVVVALAVGVYLARPAARSGNEDSGEPDTGTETVASLPRLLDLGADKCVPCKMMAPILEELKTEYAETFAVEFIDVWKNTDASSEYGIKVIPTQIFYAADGTELFRHQGFYGRDDILAKWRELGIEI